MQAFTLVCEFMYTAEIEALEDAEVAINVWMVGSALFVRGLPDYVFAKLLEALPSARLDILPGVVRQALAAWELGAGLGPLVQQQAARILQVVNELLLCKMQARSLACAAAAACWWRVRG